MADTFDRSCAHWSETGRAEMANFYEIASVDYRYLAEARDWKSWLASKQAVTGNPLKILDIACGSGKFPTALNQYADISGTHLENIEYALLDPSEFSIEEARQALRLPFVPSTEYCSTVQALNCNPGAYDIVWATHALYALPSGDIAKGLERMIHACSGEAFIAHAYSDSHYLKFQALFLDAFERHDETPYSSAENIIMALEALGASFEVEDIAYSNGTSLENHEIAEGYLQRCVFDETVSLKMMEERETLAAYLGECRATGAWKFNQRVALISIKT